MKTVIVTGASRGLGYAIVHKLLAQDTAVVAIARNTESLSSLEGQFTSRLKVVTGDVCDKKTIQTALVHAETLGSLDGVIFNAGVLDPVAKVCDAQVNQWRKLFDINLFSIVESLPVLLPSLRQSKGRIVMISSGAATGSYQGWSAYGCSKAAMNHLVQDLGVEEPDVISIAVRPGVVDTDMQKSIREQHGHVMKQDNHQKFTKLKQDGQLGDPNVVGEVIAYLSLHADASLSGKFVEWKDFQTKIA